MLYFRRLARPAKFFFRCMLFLCAVLILGTAGSLYSQTYTPIADFTESTGRGPWNTLVQARSGDLFGATWLGGPSHFGSIFRVSLTGGLTDIYDFNPIYAAAQPQGMLAAPDGNIYGVDDYDGPFQLGAIYRLQPDGTVTYLHTFDGSDGKAPLGLTLGADGNFYGLTSSGGALGFGTFFRVTPSGDFTTIYAFGNPGDPASPAGNLVLGYDGNFYATSAEGGTGRNLGTVFRITPSGSLTILHSFNNVGNEARPLPTIALSPDGNVYGIAGGTPGFTLFRISAAGNYARVFTFNTSEATNQLNSLVAANDGKFYFTTNLGGADNRGALYQISSAGLKTVLHDFDLPTGAYPEALMQHTNGLLYGTAYGGGGARDNDGAIYSFDNGITAFVSLLPYIARAGSVIGIFGQNFDGTSTVSFNGIPASSISVLSPTFLFATIPSGASSGLVTVNTSSATYTSIQKMIVR